MDSKLAALQNEFVNGRQISVTHFYPISSDRYAIGYWSGAFFFSGVWSWGGLVFTKVN